MKKLNVILLIFSFILSGIGGIFLFGATASMQENAIKTNAPITEEIIYTMKSAEDYYIDYFNLPSEVYSVDAETGIKTIDFSKITRKTVSEGINLIYNGSILYNITSQDYTGSGTQTDPYIINSLNGFLYLLNPDFSRIGITNKYLKLNCDLVFNDEIFDKNGNPSGGDGVYYNWKYSLFSSTNFDGNNHTISGLYGKTLETDSEEAFTRSLFGRSGLITLENLTMKNVYIDGGEKEQTSTICRGITQKMSNCKVISGNVKGDLYVGGLVYYSYFTEDCENFADVYSSYMHVGGIVCFAYGDVDSCNNYGNITVENTKSGSGRAGGIAYSMATAFSDITISNCNNYGNINANQRTQNGGIISWGHGTIINCNNYGNISGKEVDGGIVAYSRENKPLSIINCNNYGEIQGFHLSSGQFLGCNAESSNNNSVILIKDCYSYSKSRLPIYSFLRGKATLKIENCKVEYVGSHAGADEFFAIFYNLKETAKIEIANVEIAHNSSSSKIMYLYGNIYVGSNVTMKNIVVNLKDPESKVQLNRYDKGNPIIEGLIVSGGTADFYYGSNFSGLYFSWRVGKIGVVAIDGRGSFQGVIDEEWLANKGYKKREV